MRVLRVGESGLGLGALIAGPAGWHSRRCPVPAGLGLRTELRPAIRPSSMLVSPRVDGPQGAVISCYYEGSQRETSWCVISK